MDIFFANITGYVMLGKNQRKYAGIRGRMPASHRDIEKGVW